jgi:hypothetical protein
MSLAPSGVAPTPRAHTPQARSRAGALVTVLGIALIARMTLSAAPPGPPAPRWCLVCGPQGVQDTVLNVLLFLPLGVGLGLLRIGARRGVALAFALSAAVELLQLRLVTGRDTSIGDLLANTGGAGVGVTLSRAWRAWLVPTPSAGRRLAAAALGAWLALLAFTGWALLPSIPAADVYYGQWARPFTHYARFPGRVLAASLDGIAIPDDRIAPDEPLRAALSSSEAALRARVVDGGATPPGSVAPIVGIAHPRQFHVLTLDQQERDLLFRVRLRAADARLRTPAARLADVFGADAPGGSRRGDTLALIALARRDRLRLASRVDHPAPGRARSAELPLSAALGWSLLWPFEVVSVAAARALSAIWLASLALPVTYWSRRADGGRSAGTRSVSGAPRVGAWSVLAAVGLAAGLLVGPIVWRVAAAHWLEWAGAAAGAALGWWLGGLGTARRA